MDLGLDENCATKNEANDIIAPNIDLANEAGHISVEHYSGTPHSDSNNLKSSSVEILGNVPSNGSFFILCKSCFWIASTFGAAVSECIFSLCPVCSNSEVAFISLGNSGSVLKEKLEKGEDAAPVMLSKRQYKRPIKSRLKSQHRNSSSEKAAAEVVDDDI